jgi:hypothetical protein
MRKAYPDSPNAKTPLFAVANGIDCQRLSFDRVIFLDIDGVLHPESGDPDLQFCFVTNFFEVLESVCPQRDVPVDHGSVARAFSGCDAPSDGGCDARSGCQLGAPNQCEQAIRDPGVDARYFSQRSVVGDRRQGRTIRGRLQERFSCPAVPPWNGGGTQSSGQR